MWALREMGHEVTTVGPAQGAYMPWPLTGRYDYRPYEWKPDINASSMDGRNLTFALDKAERPDLILQLDSIIRTPDAWRGVPNVIWAIDNHVGDYSEVAEWVDRIYIAHSWGNMKDLPNAKWLPAGYDERTHFVIDENAERDIDVLCIGNPYPERMALIEALRGAGINVRYECGPVYGEYNALYNRAKIALVKTKCGDFSTRHLENMAAGCLVVSDYTSDLYRLGFEDMVHYYRYNNADDCIELVSDWLSDYNTIHRLWVQDTVSNARAAVASHTWRARLQTIIEDVTGIAGSE